MAEFVILEMLWMGLLGTLGGFFIGMGLNDIRGALWRIM